MADIAKVKRNIRRMLDAGASDAEVQNYIGTEGVTIDDLKADAAASVGVRLVKPDDPGILKSSLMTLGNAMNLGWGDELRAATDSLLGKGSYSDLLKAKRAEREMGERAHPIATGAANVLGTMAPAALPAVGPSLEGASMMTRGALGAVEGGLFGAVSGAGSNDEDRLRGASEGALVGIPLGGVAGAAIPAPSPIPVMPGSRAARITRAFERSGIDPSVPVVTENRGVAGLSNALNETIGGFPITRGTRRQITQANDRVEKLAGKLSDVGDAATAGERIRDSAKAFREAPDPLAHGMATNYASRQEDLYKNAQSMIDPGAVTSAPHAIEALDRIQRKISDPNIRKFVTDANYQRLEGLIRGASDRGITFSDLRELRTAIRKLRDSNESAVGVNKTTLESLYDGLTRDMHQLAASSGGPSAAHALRDADAFTHVMESKWFPQIQNILDAPSGERVFQRVQQLAGTGAGADWKRLSTLRQSVAPQAWDDLTATVIRQMGDPKPNEITSTEATRFSPATFMTNYERLSPQGKRLLFARRGNEGLQGALDDLTTAMGELKRVQSLGNPSGTWRLGSGGLVLTGMFTRPVETGILLGMANVTSRALMSPKIVRWMTGVTKAEANMARRNAGLPERVGYLQKAAKRIPAIVGPDTEMGHYLNGLLQPNDEASPEKRVGGGAVGMKSGGAAKKKAAPAPNAKFTKFAQKRLNKLGFAVDLTGVNDDQTQAAIKALQEKAGLKQTGMVDNATLTVLRKDALPVTPPIPRTKPVREASVSAGVDVPKRVPKQTHYEEREYDPSEMRIANSYRSIAASRNAAARDYAYDKERAMLPHITERDFASRFSDPREGAGHPAKAHVASKREVIVPVGRPSLDKAPPVERFNEMASSAMPNDDFAPIASFRAWLLPESMLSSEDKRQSLIDTLPSVARRTAAGR